MIRRAKTKEHPFFIFCKPSLTGWYKVCKIFLIISMTFPQENVVFYPYPIFTLKIYFLIIQEQMFHI